MSALTELIAALSRAAGESGGKALDKVGADYLSGAAQRGTFQRGREFAKTPEGLAQQFDWSVPKELDPGLPGSAKRLGDPNDPTSAAWMFPMTHEELSRYGQSMSRDGKQNGYTPFTEKNALPQGNYYTFDTGSFKGGTGTGKKAYPTLYGNVLADPEGFNIKDSLTGANAYRNNYNLANAIMRQPNAGERLLASPEQFKHLPVDVSDFRTAGPERQIGTLQTEGALQTLQRMQNAAAWRPDSPMGKALGDLPGKLYSGMSPADLQAAYATLKGADSSGLDSIGPGALRKLGIVQDSLLGHTVDPSAFRGLEFKEGGLATAHRCGCI